MDQHQMTSEDTQKDISHIEPDTQPNGNSGQDYQDVKYYPILKVDKLYAGLPLFTATPTYVARQGETVVVDDGSSTRQVCSYLNGTWRCISFGTNTLTFTQVDQSEHSATNPNTWETYDVSSIVPAGTQSVEVIMHNTGATTHSAKTRKNGDTTITTLFAIIAGAFVTELCPVDTNRIIQINTTNTGEMGFRIVGYWK